ncbi:hypothetical protein EMPS_04721 [Entomortierella parvispora]|uniref:RING-type domain-containing protein n=1 Tax=Entomortierella parvispora TaxID=205924 RepID=A0A9P3H952_9FUNG|nr:hypothetical protein EMPS_04721 [Entomortierella parvispora]
MHKFTSPPMFTSFGYQPSIFMDSSPKSSLLLTTTLQPTFENPVRGHGVQGQALADHSHHDLVQVRVDGETPRCYDPTANSSGNLYSSLWMASVPASPIPGQEEGYRSVESDDPEADDDMMEWTSCCSSPLFPPLPELVRSDEPSPEMEVVPDDPLTSNSGPLSFAFQQHIIHPRLPFRGRSRSMFLATDHHNNRSSSNAYRRVSDFLQNTSIQSIQDWFKNTVEPKALEHGRNLSLLNSLTTLYGAGSTSLVEKGDCPICFQSGSTTIMKVNVNCGHRTCWKCEQSLNRAGNVACPLCRRIRFISTFENLADLFKVTIGLLPRDYVHSTETPRAVMSPAQDPSDPFGLEATENLAMVEHELSDRYLWEPNTSFLEYLQSFALASSCPISDPSLLLQYYQLNAAQDLCYHPFNEINLPEYSDDALIDPPTSGLVLPPHRLYITLIHYCLDLITLPNPQEFQSRVQFKREYMVVELVLLFLVPTDQYSPRGSERIHDAKAWIEHGQWILARIHRFLSSRARLSKMELEGQNQGETTSTHAEDASVPSVPIPRRILYLGVERWIWIAQSLIHLIGWIQTASENPLMMEPFQNRGRRHPSSESTVIKRALDAQYQSPRPKKRARRSR